MVVNSRKTIIRTTLWEKFITLYKADDAHFFPFSIFFLFLRTILCLLEQYNAAKSICLNQYQFSHYNTIINQDNDNFKNYTIPFNKYNKIHCNKFKEHTDCRDPLIDWPSVRIGRVLLQTRQSEICHEKSFPKALSVIHLFQCILNLEIYQN